MKFYLNHMNGGWKKTSDGKKRLRRKARQNPPPKVT